MGLVIIPPFFMIFFSIFIALPDSDFPLILFWMECIALVMEPDVQWKRDIPRSSAQLVPVLLGMENCQPADDEDITDEADDITEEDDIAEDDIIEDDEDDMAPSVANAALVIVMAIVPAARREKYFLIRNVEQKK